MTAIVEPRTGVSTASADVPAAHDAQSAHRAGRASAFLERFNRPITIVAAIAILVLDRFVAPTMGMGAAYVAVVLLSLWAPRTRDTYLAALLCTAFLVFDTVSTKTDVSMWLYAANRALAIGVIWMTAVMCLWRKRQQAADARALAQAESALLESREVLQAIDRAEKAEEAHRQAEARLARAIRGTSDGPW